MEGLLRRLIAVGRAIWTGIAVEAAAAHAGTAARCRAHAQGMPHDRNPRPNARRPDRLSGKVFRHIDRKGESPREVARSEFPHRTAARRDRRARGRIPGASGCRAAMAADPPRASPIAGTADRAGRRATPPAPRSVSATAPITWRRPCVERIFQISALRPPPGHEVWPRCGSSLPNQQNGSGGRARGTGRRQVPMVEIETATRNHAVARKFSQAASRNAGRPAVTLGFFAASACASARRSSNKSAATAPRPRAARRPQ